MEANEIMTKKEEKMGEWLERSMDYEVGIEHTNLNIIKSMLENGANYNFISKVTKKSIKEIKKMENVIFLKIN